IHDNFFVLGGHSLLLIQLATRIRETFEVDVPLRTLFEAQTIATMSAQITQRLIEEEDPEELTGLLQEMRDLSPDQLRLLLQAEED
ncbi:MAG TPA: phosphopantetheine-binding protein, partial [Herpetosiphonaceae bacterium]